jgi:enoyl-CoA hydratase
VTTIGQPLTHNDDAYGVEEFKSEGLAIDLDGNVATLWLNRPDHRNAITQAWFDDLMYGAALLAGDSRVRAVVVAAHGPDFCVGLDLKDPGPTFGQLGGKSDEGSTASQALSTYRHARRHQDSFSAVADLRKPVIAAVHGNCVGGGLDLIACCDVRFASADARFSVAETRMAIVADMGSLQRLPHIISRGDLMELALTGRRIDAQRAQLIRLVNDVFPDRDGAIAAAQALAGELAAMSPLAVQGTKEVLAASEGRSVAEGLDYVALWQAAMLRSNDLTEAVQSFRTKKQPQFTGT